MNIVLLILAGLAAFIIIRMFIFTRPDIDLATAQAALKSGTAILVDVREPEEWGAGVAKGAALLPFSDLRGQRTQWRAFLDKHRDRKLLLYCHSGSRSGMAAVQLRKEGLDAINAGSLRGWDRAGWPVCVPKDLRR